MNTTSNLNQCRYGFRVIEKDTLIDITEMYDWYLKPNGDLGYISDENKELPEVFVVISKLQKEPVINA